AIRKPWCISCSGVEIDAAWKEAGAPGIQHSRIGGATASRHPFTLPFLRALHACAFFGRSRAAVVAGWNIPLHAREPRIIAPDLRQNHSATVWKSDGCGPSAWTLLAILRSSGHDNQLRGNGEHHAGHT